MICFCDLAISVDDGFFRSGPDSCWCKNSEKQLLYESVVRLL